MLPLARGLRRAREPRGSFVPEHRARAGSGVQLAICGHLASAGYLRARDSAGYLRAPRLRWLSAATAPQLAICGSRLLEHTGAPSLAMGRTARVSATADIGVGAPFAVLGEWWEGSERPLDSNVRTPRSRSWPVQSCERSGYGEARPLRLCLSPRGVAHLPATVRRDRETKRDPLLGTRQQLHSELRRLYSRSESSSRKGPRETVAPCSWVWRPMREVSDLHDGTETEADGGRKKAERVALRKKHFVRSSERAKSATCGS